uniref:Uncharacterized protein n=1 Tax=Rhizophora mucronata TaxID=61149 RepID=A0A2P2QHE7_RHIMU
MSHGPCVLHYHRTLRNLITMKPNIVLQNDGRIKLPWKCFPS